MPLEHEREQSLIKGFVDDTQAAWNYAYGWPMSLPDRIARGTAAFFVLETALVIHTAQEGVRRLLPSRVENQER